MEAARAFLLLCAVLPAGPTAAVAQDGDPWAALILEGQALFQAGDPAAALERFRSAREIVEDEDRDGRDRIVTLTSLGQAHGAMGDFSLAAEQHARSLDLRVELYGEPSLAAATGLRHLAGVRRDQGLLAETSTLLRRALSNLEGIGEGESADARAAKAGLASVHHGMGRYADALALYDELVPAARGGPADRLVGILAGLAATLDAAGRPTEALEALTEALEIARRDLPGPHPSTASVLNSLGEHLRRRGDGEAALPYYEEALAMRLVLHGEGDARTAPILNNIGLALFDLDRLDEARTHLDAAFLATASAFGERHQAVAIVLGNLADVIEAQGAFGAAVEANRSALRVLEERNGPAHPDVARLRAGYGRRLVAAGALELAAPELEAARTALEDAYGPVHADVAQVAASQAELARLSGDLDLALERNGEARAILRALGLDGALDYADLTEARAAIHRTTRDLERAALLLAEALAIREAHWGAGDPRLAGSLRDYAFVLRRLRRADEAAEIERRAAALAGSANE